MARKSRKFYFWHIWWRAIAPQHLVFMKNGGQPHKSSLYFHSESDNRVEKPFFYQEIWLFENTI